VQLEPLDVYKALGDETRYELFSILLDSPAPLSTAELASRLQLHPNTVRPHLERMRQAGLVELEVSGSGTVGRPSHRYRPAAGITGPADRLVGSET
jgi:predicted ArsR family transcriptional regulator